MKTAAISKQNMGTMTSQKRIFLISCVSKKLNYSAPAGELYESALFKKSLSYAKAQNPDEIFVLSALYGLVPIDMVIAPYDKTLNEMSSKENLAWANNVLDSLQAKFDLKRDQFVFLAGINYRKNIIPKITNFKIPMLGLPIGKQLQFLGSSHE